MTKTTTKQKAEAELFNAPPVQTVEQAAAGKAVAVHKPRAKSPATAPAPARIVTDSSPVAVMEMIERVAMNANVNPDALEKLLSLQERILDRQAKLAFNEAFVLMAPELPLITKDGRIIVKEKNQQTGRRDGETTQDTPYAKWEAISPIIVPILSDHGFSIRHRTSTAPDGKIRITVLLYGHGHLEESYMDFEIDATGSKNNAQGRISATTYGRRITASAALNIVTKGEDDDGKGSGKSIVVGDPLTPEELEELTTFGSAVLCSAPYLLKHLNSTRPQKHSVMKSLEELPRTRFQEAIDALKSYDQNRRERDKAKANAK